MTEQRVPARALRFDAQFELTGARDSKGVPVRMTARGAGEVTHWYWGRIVHDFAGMRLSQKKIPIDYCHDSGEVLGFADQFSAANGPLTIAGMLTPYGEKDRANEVIAKSKAGVPYQASIFFDNPIKLERLSENDRASVNGREFAGPGLIIRQWTLRGVAICPYGVDATTSTEFSGNHDVTVAVSQYQAQTTVADKKSLLGLSEGQERFAQAIATQIARLKSRSLNHEGEITNDVEQV
jgi:hypothetical protein